MLEGDKSHEPTPRDVRHGRWLAMQSAYAEYRGASEALDCTRQSANESSTNERSPATIAVDRQRVAFECYFEARMEFLESRFDESNRPVIKEELAERRRKLLMLSEYSVLNAYREAHERCKMEGDALPRASAVQELVTAWRVLSSWRRRK